MWSKLESLRARLPELERMQSDPAVLGSHREMQRVRHAERCGKLGDPVLGQAIVGAIDGNDLVAWRVNVNLELGKGPQCLIAGYRARPSFPSHSAVELDLYEWAHCGILCPRE